MPSSQQQKQLQITEKKQETTAHSQVEHKLIENIQEEAHILDILDKNYKLTLFLNMLRGLLETINK